MGGWRSRATRSVGARSSVAVVALAAILALSFLLSALPVGTAAVPRPAAPIPLRPGPGGVPVRTSAIPATLASARPEASRRAATDPVDPFAVYSSEPAPMGLADYGLGASGAYSFSTVSLLGIATWGRLSWMNGSLGAYTYDAALQVSGVLQYSLNGNSYSYYIVDTAGINESNGVVQFFSFIYNVSAPGASLAFGEVVGNGTITSGVYFDEASSGLPGENQPVSTPGSLRLYLYSETNPSTGEPEVVFEYLNSAYTTSLVEFDSPMFVTPPGTLVDSNFEIDGTTNTPSGNFYDAELVVGSSAPPGAQVAGPGLNLSLQLYEWNGHDFQAPLNAYNFGANSVDTIANLSVDESPGPNGLLHAALRNGTAGNATPAVLYSRTQVAVLNLTAAGGANGTLYLGAGRATFGFVDGAVAQTLAPGTYPIRVVLSNGTGYYLGNCSLAAGATLSLTIAHDACAPSVPPLHITSFGVSPDPVLVNHTTNFTVAATGGASPGNDTFAYTGLPPGCASANVTLLLCRPASPGNFTVRVTVTDPARNTAVANVTLNVTSTIAPLTLSSFLASPNPVAVGTNLTITANVSAGSPPYTFVYSGLPAGCATINASILRCLPTAPGNFSVRVNVTDAAGGSVNATLTLTVTSTIPPPPHLVVTDFTVSPATVRANLSVDFRVNVTGGAGSFTFTYTGLPAGCIGRNVSEFSCAPTAPGTYLVRVDVSDTAGQSATRETNLTVTPVTSGTTGGSSSSSPGIFSLAFWTSPTGELLIALIVLAAIVIPVAAVLGARRRRALAAQTTTVTTTAPTGGVTPWTPPPGPASPPVVAADAAAATAAPAAAATAPPPALPAASYCPHCGSAIAAGSVFCPRCGQRVGEPPT